MLAPVTVKIALAVEHKVPEGAGVTIKLGKGFTAKVTVFTLVQLPVVPLTVYIVVVVESGVTVGVALFTPDTLVEGDHV